MAFLGIFPSCWGTVGGGAGGDRPSKWGWQVVSSGVTTQDKGSLDVLKGELRIAIDEEELCFEFPDVGTEAR